ncbi:hypothetical protein EON65_37315 [archaeon]|nr:MAG: hypothetical protein EON65_37315 [archaeon]
MEQVRRDAILSVDDDINNVEPQSKRARVEDLGNTPEEILWKSSAHKDRAMANYYRRLSMNNEIEFFQQILDLEGVAEALKRNLRTKLNTLITKKLEDKYEDINL